jgi:hypothetical protein
LTTSENAPISAKYDCRIKVQYHKDIMSLLEEGMIFAVKNFKNKLESFKLKERYTLLVASRIWPEHYGLRAISDHTYYPMQFEVIEQSVTDWDTDDKSTMMIQISAIPVNYDLIVNNNEKDSFSYVKGFSYPLIGDEVYLLNANTVMELYNRKVLDKTLEFAPGEWLLSSYIATGIDNVPIFIKADNAENEVNTFLNNK